MSTYEASSQQSAVRVAGFTLIELLVVIGIIALLSSLILVNFSSSRKTGRDNKRIADFAALSGALELYFSENRVYPDTTGELVSAGYLPVLPKDPKTNTDYQPYLKGLSGNPAVRTAYKLCVSLEKNTAAMKNDGGSSDSWYEVGSGSYASSGSGNPDKTWKNLTCS